MNTGVAFPAGVSSTIAPQMIGAFDAVASQSLEVKRRKLLDGGASAGSVRLCTICNVACNRQEAFNAHLIGKRHVTQVHLITLHISSVIDIFLETMGFIWEEQFRLALEIEENSETIVIVFAQSLMLNERRCS